MGIDTYFYTIYGVKVDWDDDFNEAYDAVYDNADTPWVLLDGMGGEYMIFGFPLFTSGNLRWGFEDGDYYKEIDNLPELDFKEIDYRKEFAKKFPKFIHLLEDKPFKLISLIHYS
jgi:hypothetical protein